jgi:hypothetical protein
VDHVDLLGNLVVLELLEREGLLEIQDHGDQLALLDLEG